MLNIFICEDNEVQRETLNKFVKDILLIEDLDMKLTLSTSNPEEILDYLKCNKGNGLYFLDVDLNTHINGIALGEKIREYDPRGFIVFITTHGELSYLTFLHKVEAMDYIIKDNFSTVRERLHECIIKANTRYCSRNNTLQNIFTIKYDDKIINVELDKILFFETSPIIHKIVIHALDRQIEFYAKMKDIESSLSENFYRCHRSFIVNKNNIKEIDKINRIIYMINGEKCLASTRGIKGLP